MNTIAILVLCVQACFVQKAFSQCSGGYGAEVINNPGSGYETAIPIAPAAGLISSRCGNPAGLGYGVPAIDLGNAGIGSYGLPAAGLGTAAAYGATSGAAYGGAGEGNVAVAGDLPVGGATTVIGEVPILGAVNFGGNLPAAGAVSITANCACGCGGY